MAEAAEVPPYVAPAGMAGMTPATAQDWIETHLSPTQPQLAHLFEHVFTDLNQALTTCRLSNRQKYAVLRQGVQEIGDLTMLGTSVDNVRSIFKGFNTLTDARGGVNFGAIHYTRVFALVSFAKDKKRRGQDIVAADFTAQVVEEYILKAEAKLKDDKGELDLPAPPDLTDGNFHKWEQAVYTNLLSKTGTSGIPLAYVIRKETAPEDFANDMERLIYEASRTGAGWDEDNKTVGIYITSLLTGKSAETWIKRHVKSQDGKSMMTALRVHYLGQSQKEKIIEDARKKKDGAFYKSQAAYPFDRFTTDLEDAFQTLHDYDEEVNEAEKMRLLREKIDTDNASFNASVMAVLMRPDITTFADATAEVNVLVGKFFPPTQGKPRGRYGISQVDVSQFVTSTSNGRRFHNGVDITDLTRYYPHREWQKLSRELQRAISKAKAEAGQNGGGTGKGKRKVKGLKKKVKKMKTQIAALSKKVSSMESGNDKTEEPQDEAKSNDSGQSGSEATGPNAYAKQGGKSGTSVEQVIVRGVHHTGTQRTGTAVCGSKSVSRVSHDTAPVYHRTWLDEDSHADMHCAGANFTVLAQTGYTCDVDPFLDSYDTTSDVQVVKAATAVQLSADEVIYLVSSASLWFGDKLEHSLFNANIARDSGLEVCTDPTDPNRPLGIRDRGRGLMVPMVRHGNSVGLKTYKPERDDVLEAINIGGKNVIYLDPNVEYCPTELEPEIDRVDVRTQVIAGVDVSEEPQCSEDTDYITLAQISEALDPHLYMHKMVGRVMISDVESKAADQVEKVAQVSAVAMKGRHSQVTPERVSHIFGCGLETAKETIRVTTQYGVRHAVHPLRRRYRTDLMSLNYRRLRTHMYTDTMHFKTKSLAQNTCAQVFTTRAWVGVYPMKGEGEAGDSLRLLAEDVGVPNNLTYDNAPAMTGPNTVFQKTARFLRIQCKTIEPHTSRQNPGERMIGELRRRWRDKRRAKAVPRRLWDYVLVWVAEIISRTYNKRLGRTGIEELTGDTTDITEWVDFDIYDEVWYWDSPHAEENPKPGRWLGVSHRVGSAMCFYVVNRKGEVLSRTTVQHPTAEEMKSGDVKKQFEAMNKGIEERLNDANFVNEAPGMLYEEDIEDEFGEVDEGIDNPLPVDPSALAGDVEEDPNTFDEYLGAELILDAGPEGSPLRGRVIKRAKGEDGNPIGTAHGNPLLDTRRYEVEFNGIPHEYTANQIAENLFSQVDSEGRRQLIFKGIIDHRKDGTAIDRSDGKVKTRGGQLRPKITTRGWFLKVEWKDGTASWLPLSEVKNSSPVEAAEYAVASKIDDEPAFAWWVPAVLKKRNKIIAKVKSRYWRTTHKFGLRLPHSLEEAYQIDRDNKNDFWRRAIEKEMTRVRVAFEKWQGGSTEDEAREKLVGYQQMRGHLVFDIRLDGLVRKARFVAGGHETETPSSITYSSVVSRDSVRIAFLIAALNDVDLMSADIGNAYLNAPCREKIWMKAGPEFGDEKDTIFLVVRALYGLKSAGASWRSFFSQTLQELGFKPTRGDPDVYIRPQVKENGFKYYEMILVYVDDILVVSHDTKPIMDEISSTFRLKEDSLGPPRRYLGAGIKIFTDDEGRECWSMSADDYVRVVLDDVETDLAKQGKKLRGKAQRPFSSNYRPEIDVTKELDDDGVAKFQSYMGIFRWMIELGRIDIITEVSMLTSHQVLPREGHLEACYSIFAYLRKNPNMSMVFHPSTMQVDERRFKKADWTDFYGDVEESIPEDMPKPLGNPVKMTAWVDSDHAGNLVTRRSQTGYLIFLNQSPVLWYSKRQNTVEASTFGAEFIAARTCLEAIEGLRFKLRMFGIPIDGPTDMLCDNNSVVCSAQRPESTLSKKHLSICWHRVREACASLTIRMGKVESEKNLSDLCTKPLPTPRRYDLLTGIVWMSKKRLRDVEQQDFRLNRGFK